MNKPGSPYADWRERDSTTARQVAHIQHDAWQEGYDAGIEAVIELLDQERQSWIFSDIPGTRRLMVEIKKDLGVE